MFIVENRELRLGKSHYIFAAIAMFVFCSFGGLLTMHVRYDPRLSPKANS